MGAKVVVLRRRRGQGHRVPLGGFGLVMHLAPGFGRLSRGDLTLLLNTPGAGGSGTAGSQPEQGGWDRFQMEVDDPNAQTEGLRGVSVITSCNRVAGKRGHQILIEDPSGKPIELFDGFEQGEESD